MLLGSSRTLTYPTEATTVLVGPPRLMDGSVLRRAVYQAVRRAGLTKPASYHTFRHSFATHLLEHGHDILRSRRCSGARTSARP